MVSGQQRSSGFSLVAASTDLAPGRGVPRVSRVPHWTPGEHGRPAFQACGLGSLWLHGAAPGLCTASLCATVFKGFKGQKQVCGIEDTKINPSTFKVGLMEVLAWPDFLKEL